MGVSSKKNGVTATEAPRGAERADGWFSSLTGFGVSGKDKRVSVGHEQVTLSRSEIESLWRGNDIAARIIETLPNEALRQGFTLNMGDKEQAEDVMSIIEDSQAITAFRTALRYARGFGGGAIYPVINDGQGDLALPINMDRIPTVGHYIALEAQELSPTNWYTSLADKKYGEPSHYNVQPLVRGASSSHTRIHESRLILFPGIRVSRSQMSSGINEWGDSVLCRPYEILRDFGIAWAATSALLHEFAQASFKIKGLAELMASDKDDVIKTRIRAVELSRSTIGAVMMDSDEEYERKQTPVAGLSDLLARFATRLAAAADMPVTLLMGQSPAGLNATGDSDVRFFYDRVSSYQEIYIKPHLEQLIKFILLAKDGPTNGKEPDNWSIDFNPLWQPSEKEIADTRKVVADTDAINIELGLVSPHEVSLSRFGGDTYSMETVVDFDERASLEEMGEGDEGDEGEVLETGELSTAGEDNVAATAMNGAQVSSLVQIVTASAQGLLSRESATGILKTAFRLSSAEALEILGPEGFVPASPETIEENSKGESPPTEEEIEDTEDEPDQPEEEELADDQED